MVHKALELGADRQIRTRLFLLVSGRSIRIPAAVLGPSRLSQPWGCPCRALPALVTTPPASSVTSGKQRDIHTVQKRGLSYALSLQVDLQI